MASTDNIDDRHRRRRRARGAARISPSIRSLVGAQLVNQLQSIVSRNVDPLDAAVVSICVFQAGSADNIIPQTARLRGTARSLRPEVRDLLEKRLHEVVESGRQGPRRDGEAHLRRGYPVLANHERETAFAASIAERGRRSRSRRYRRWRR